jgi:hypothetical protein
MNTYPRPPSAKIYQFPLRISANPGGSGRQIKSAPDPRLRPLPTVEFGSGWYHEAAINADMPHKS